MVSFYPQVVVSGLCSTRHRLGDCWLSQGSDRAWHGVKRDKRASFIPLAMFWPSLEKKKYEGF